MTSRILHTLSARKCRNKECLAREFHTHHFTWIGKIRYGLPWRDVRTTR